MNTMKTMILMVVLTVLVVFAGSALGGRNGAVMAFALATGRNPNHAAVAVTTGILNILDKDELSGVLGHELAHIKHRDILIGTIAATMAGAISMLASMARWGAIFGGGRSDEEGGGGGGIFLFVLIFTMVGSIAAMLV